MMTATMRIGTSISAVLLALSAFSHGQAVPTAVSTTTPATSAGIDTMFTLPSADGMVHYALGASEIVQYGYYGPGNLTPTGAISGNASYSSTNENLPFNMLFAGGLLFPERSGINPTTYLDLSASQGLVLKKWVFSISDALSYLPQSSTSGFSGIPGVGDVGTIGGGSGDILTRSGSRIGNGVTGTAERLFTGRTSMSGSGFYSILHFLNASEGFDTSQYGGQAALNHRLDARDTVSAEAVYSLYNYGKTEDGISFASRGVNGVVSRVLSHTLSAHISAGPQWVSSNNSALIPNRLNVAVNAGLAYQRKLTSVDLDYSRGVSGGAGVQLGGLRDMVMATMSHSINPDWLMTAHLGYTHTGGLANTGVIQPPTLTIPLGGTFSTVVGGVQFTRRIGRTLSAYGSYTAQHQSVDGNYTGTTAFSGTSHTFGIGISYTPRSTRLGQF